MFLLVSSLLASWLASSNNDYIIADNVLNKAHFYSLLRVYTHRVLILCLIKKIDAFNRELHQYSKLCFYHIIHKLDYLLRI